MNDGLSALVTPTFLLERLESSMTSKHISERSDETIVAEQRVTSLVEAGYNEMLQ